jgi:hypothetical protein
MMKTNMPISDYDKELSASGKKRIRVTDSIVYPNGHVAWVVREKVVPENFVYNVMQLKKKGRKRMNADPVAVTAAETAVNSIVRNRVSVERAPKAPRNGSKLSQAVELVNEAGKDDKEACLAKIIEVLGVTRGNATIYYAKAKAILG